MASVMSKVCSWPKEEGDVKVDCGVTFRTAFWRRRGKSGRLGRVWIGDER